MILRMDLSLAFPEQLSQHLRSMRKVRGLTQAQLAARMGVTQSRISAIETDATKLTNEQLLRVLSALDASMVLRMADPRPTATAPEPGSKPMADDTGGLW
jgi:HTH-type transcriptional regulator/antitoxin HipB